MRYRHTIPAILVLLAACGANDFVDPSKAVVNEYMDFVVDWPRLNDDSFAVSSYSITRVWWEFGWGGDNHKTSRLVASGDVILDGSFVIRGQVECWQDPRYHRDTEYILRVRGNYPSRPDCGASFETVQQCPSQLHSWTVTRESSEGNGCTPPS